MRGEVARIRERLLLSGDHLYVLGFTFGADSIFEEVVGFSPLWFLQGKFFVSLVSFIIIIVHVILSVKDPKTIILA